MAKTTQRKLELEIEGLCRAISQILGKMDYFDTGGGINETDKCIKEGLIKDYCIKLTPTTLEMEVYGEDFMRFITWDKSADGTLTLRKL